MPGVNIPIISKKNLSIKNPQVIVFAWNFDEIKNNSNISKKFISIKSLGQKNKTN